MARQTRGILFLDDALVNGPEQGVLYQAHDALGFQWRDFVVIAAEEEPLLQDAAIIARLRYLNIKVVAEKGFRITADDNYTLINRGVSKLQLRIFVELIRANEQVELIDLQP